MAEAPALQHLYPIAVQQGTSNSISVSGKFDPWPPQAWIDAPGIQFHPADEKGKFRVEVASDAPTGPHLVRLYNQEGASAPRFLVVTAEAELRDHEPNDEFAKAQPIASLPASINGKLDKSRDVDSFAITLEQGQYLIVSAEAYILGSAVDAMLRLIDSNGVQLAFNHDNRTLDPFLVWQAKAGGTYILQIMGFAYPANADVGLTGGDGCVYRLHLFAGPYLRHTVPLAVQRGRKTSLQFIGWNLPMSTIDFDPAEFTCDTNASGLSIPGFNSQFRLLLSDYPELQEKEPNNSTQEAQSIDIPGGITGRIDRSADEDFFRFKAEKEQRLEFAINSANHGFPLDGWVRIENLSGTELSRKDDSEGTRDPRLVWTAPESGEYIAVIGDLTHKGGADYLYRLAVSPAAQRLKAIANSHALAIEPGKTNEIKITLSRENGFQAPLVIKPKCLPQTVSIEPVEVSEKSNEAILKIVADPDATPHNGPYHIVVINQQSGQEQTAIFELSSSSVDNGVPQGYRELLIPQTDQLWLTILPRKEPATDNNQEQQ